MPADTLRIVPLGGLGEVGKNMTAFEADGDVLVVDAGLAFPRDEHLGVDLILPDFSYLRERAGRIRAVVLTHGHEDHVGALPYVLREIRVGQVLATRLTLGLVKSKLDEHGLMNATELREIDPNDAPLELGPFRLEFVRMAHSIPDNVAVVLETPGGRILQTSDYKLDHTPVDGMRTDVGRLAELGSLGVDLLLGHAHDPNQHGEDCSFPVARGHRLDRTSRVGDAEAWLVEHEPADLVRQGGAAHGAAGPAGVPPQRSRPARAVGDGRHHCGDVLELPLDGVTGGDAAGAEPSAVHREAGDAASQLVDQRVEGGVVGQRPVHQDERRAVAVGPDGDRCPIGGPDVEPVCSDLGSRPSAHGFLLGGVRQRRAVRAGGRRSRRCRTRPLSAPVA